MPVSTAVLMFLHASVGILHGAGVDWPSRRDALSIFSLVRFSSKSALVSGASCCTTLACITFSGIIIFGNTRLLHTRRAEESFTKTSSPSPMSWYYSGVELACSFVGRGFRGFVQTRCTAAAPQKPLLLSGLVPMVWTRKIQERGKKKYEN